MQRAEIAERWPQPSKLLCYLEGDPWPEAVERVQAWQVELVQLREWVVSPPEFVDTVSEADHTVGVLLSLLPTSDRHGQPNPAEVERQLLADVEALVSSAERLTEDGMLELALELDGTVVGWIEHGQSDPTLNDGLLTPWRTRAART